MFLEIEGDQLVNLSLVNRIEFDRRRQTVRLFVDGSMAIESQLAYTYLMVPANREPLLIKLAT